MSKKSKAFDSKPSSSKQDIDAFLKGGRATEASATQAPEEPAPQTRGRPKAKRDFEVRGSTFYLQDDYLDDLAMLRLTWHRNTKGREGQKKLDKSAILRAMVEVCLPVLEEFEDVENEAHLVELLRAKIK